VLTPLVLAIAYPLWALLIAAVFVLGWRLRRTLVA
jgi:hypothetical protein